MKHSRYFALMSYMACVIAVMPSTCRAERPSATDEFEAFSTNGTHIMDKKIGDLSGDGSSGAILVLDPASSEHDQSGQGLPRTVLLLARDASGTWHKVEQNDKLVPCKRCGGSSGDPFGYLGIGKGTFTIITQGGSRERWGNIYTFTYSPERKTWLLSSVRRSVADSITETSKHIMLTSKELGIVDFEHFDPAKLPDVTLP